MRNSKRSLVVVLFAGLVFGCKHISAEPNVDMKMLLSSSSFTAGQPIPEKYSSYGANVSPALTWTKPPTGTESLVLLLEDPDAPRPQPFVHWLIFNIPPSTNSISEGS